MAYGTIKVDSITFTNGGVDQTITVSGVVQSISGDITATGTIQAATIIGTSTVSGATVTGDSGQYGNLNSISGVFTTQVSGATVTGDAGSFTTVTGGVATITSGVFALGTNALPSISFSSDPNTGIYSPGADQVAISTNGTGRLFVDASGNVRIDNDTSPELSLRNSDGSINSGDSLGTLFFATADVNISGTHRDVASIQALAEAEFTATNNAKTSLVFSTNGNNTNLTEKLRITSTGELKHIGGGTEGDPAVYFAGSAPAKSLYVEATTGYVGLGTSSPGANLVVNEIATSGANHSLQQWRTASGGFLQIRCENLGLSQPYFEFTTGTGEDLILNPGGNVGVGTTSPSNKFVVSTSNQGLEVSPGSTNTLLSYDRGATAYLPIRIRASSHAFSNASTDFATIDSSGRLLVGTSSSLNVGGGSGAQIQVASTAANYLTASRWSNSASGPAIALGKSRGASPGTYSIVQSGDDLGYIFFAGDDGVDLQSNAASIGCEVDGTPGADDMPGRLVFSTNAGSPATGPTERMRIDSKGLTSLTSSAPTLTGSLGGLGGRVLSITNTETSDSVICATNTGSLNIQGGSSQPGAGIRVNGKGAATNAATIQFFATDATNDIASAERMQLNAAGELLIGYTSDNGAYKLQVNSQIFATSATIATSDGRYKENVATLDGCVDLVKALRPVSFDWKHQEPITRIDEEGETVVVREAHNFPEGTQVGFIAQEVETVLVDKPWLGSVIKQNVRAAVTDNEGNELAPEEEFLGIAEGNLVAVLTSALKDAIGEIESLKARVAALEAN